MKAIRMLTAFPRELIAKRFVIGQLVSRDLRERYVGSFLGFMWPLLQQVLLVLIMGTVLQMGLKVAPVWKIPFIAWLFPAQAMWLFFAESMNASVGVYISYAYLVKKIQFNISILPLIKVLAAAVNHSLLLVVVAVILWVSGVAPNLYWFQGFYFLFSAFALLMALGWLLSSLAVFVRDITQVLAVALNFAMWLTPIFWDIHNLHPVLKTLAWINPVSYLTEGYRKSFLYQEPFWADPLWTLYYWSVVLVLLVIGVLVFKKLRPHFADVL